LSLPTLSQLDSDGKLKNGNALAIEYVFIIRFNTETDKVVALDEIMVGFVVVPLSRT